MISLLVLAALYLLAALVLILIIDRSVGVFFPATAKQRTAKPHDRRFWILPINRNAPARISEPFP